MPNLDRLRNPAGLDLGGRSPEEVALSILGEVVQCGASGFAAAATAEQPPKTPEPQDLNTPGPQDPTTSVAVDPVCHMQVEIADAMHVGDVAGATYYFCCPGCRARFVKDPQRYLSPTS